MSSGGKKYSLKILNNLPDLITTNRHKVISNKTSRYLIFELLTTLFKDVNNQNTIFWISSPSLKFPSRAWTLMEREWSCNGSWPIQVVRQLCSSSSHWSAQQRNAEVHIKLLRDVWSWYYQLLLWVGMMKSVISKWYKWDLVRWKWHQ